MNTDEIVIRFLDESSIDGQLAVYCYAFGHEKTELLRDKWIAKHYSNPLGKSFVFGAVMNGDIVGINCFQPCCYICGDERLKALQSCESGVLPICQGKGVWSKLMRFAFDYFQREGTYDLLIGFPNYRNSYPGFVKMQWSTIANMNNYLMVNNARLFSSMMSHNRFVQVVGRLISLQKIPMLISAKKIKNAVRVESVNINEVLINHNPNTIHVDASGEWMDYKQRCKDLKAINVVYKEKVIGSCIYGLIQYKKREAICINKVTFDDEAVYPHKNIFALMCEYISNLHKETTFVRIWTTKGDDMTETVKKISFKRMSHPNPFINKLLKDIKIERVWNLSFFDLD